MARKDTTSSSSKTRAKNKETKVDNKVSESSSALADGETKGLTPQEISLLKLLKKGPKTLTWLSNNFSMPKTAVTALADKLSRKGYDIRFEDEVSGERKLFLNTEESTNTEALKITEAARKLKIAFVAEPRIGAFQSQMSMLHWLYNEVFPKENVNVVVVVGNLTVGKATPTLRPDMFITEPDELVNYVVKNYPHSPKKLKTYIIGGRRELSMRGGEGFDIIRAICSAREDLVAAGELERTFDFHGVKIRVMSPWDDNSPKGLSYGVQRIVDKMDPAPDIALFGGNHERLEIPAYGKGQTLVVTVPSLHTEMRRQTKKAIRPRLGCTIIELDFDEDGVEGRKIDLAKNVSVHHINLDGYAVSNDCYKGIDDVDLSNVTNGGRLVMEWLLEEGAISAGEISRRLALHGHQKSKLEVKDLIGRLCEGGAKIHYRSDEKRYRLVREFKDKFKPLPLKYDEVFSPLTKGASGACFHFNSKQEMPEVVQSAFDEAAEDGVRAFFMAGDISDGLGDCGYRGHDKDVKFLGADEALDHCVSVFPNTRKGKVLATPERPLRQFVRDGSFKGKPVYKEVVHTTGEHYPQEFVIDGNHDAWSRTQFGYSPVRNIAMLLGDDLVFLGRTDGSITEEGHVEFDGVFNKLLHGGGGLGYCMSAKAQRFLAAHKEEELGKGKPTVLHIGNWHTSFLMFQDEVVILDACFKYKDAFHAKLGLVAKIGLHVYELFGDKTKGNITRTVSNFRNYRGLAHKLLANVE